MSVSSFFSSEAAPSDWTDVLHENPLFEVLREGGGAAPVENGNIMCEIRGDLFVWDQSQGVLLTTNLKRLKAHPTEPQSFQTLVCTSAPLSPVCRLLPDEPGGLIALLSGQAVSVMTLPRSRGEHGEFGGGQRTVTCRVTPIATDLFTIHHHTLRLLQAHWHPSHPLTLLLLTNDSTLRVFSLADPNHPRHTVPLSPSAANQVHSCSLEDMAVAVAFSQNNRLFALRDTGDVIENSLTPPTGHAPSDPLPMHPMSEDNYGTDDAADLVLLETTPLVLIIAHSSGTLYHCVYIDPDEEGAREGREDHIQASGGSLYVVECIKLNLNEDEDKISLIKDPVLPYRYFTAHSEGMHMVTIPWANRMTQFTTTSVDELVMLADSEVEHLNIIDPSVSSVLGVAVVSESLLGQTLVCLDSDLQCIVLSLQPPPPAQYVSDIEATPTRPHPQVKPELGGFEKVVRDLLTSDLRDPLSLPRPKTPKPSQQDCFKFLQQCTQGLRERYLLPQQKVKAALQHRLDILSRQKEQQLTDLMSLRDECEEVRGECEGVQEKMVDIHQRGSQLLISRMEKLLCRLDAHSPVLSDAEVGMEQELGQLQAKLDLLNHRIEEAKGKLKLGYGKASGVEGLAMSRAQDDTICSVLEESGKRLISLKLQIKALLGAVPA